MRTIPLTQNKMAIVDDSDYTWINQWKWSALKAGNKYYAVRSTADCRIVMMHRLIAGATHGDGFIVHHKGDSLDNRRKQLVKCDHADHAKQHKQKNSPRESETVIRV